MKSYLSVFCLCLLFLVFLPLSAAGNNPESVEGLAGQNDSFMPINPATNATALSPVQNAHFSNETAVYKAVQPIKGRVTQEQAELIAEARGRALFLKKTADDLQQSEGANFIWGGSGYKEDFIVAAEALFSIRATNFKLIEEEGGTMAVEVTVVRTAKYPNLQVAINDGVAEKNYLILLGMTLRREIDTLKIIEEKLPEALRPSDSLASNFLPIEPEADTLRALALLRESILPPKNTGGPDPVYVEKTMRQAANLDPWNPLPFLIMGENQLKMANASQAAATLTHAIELKPDFSQALLARGTAYLRLKLMKLAIDDYSAAIKLMPENSVYYMARASAFLVEEKFDDMCRDFQRACSLGSCDGYHWGISRGHCKNN